MNKKASALLVRLQFESARSAAFRAGVPAGPGSEKYLASFIDYWNNLDKRVEEIEKQANETEASG